MINTALVIEDPRGIEVFRILQKSGEINLIGLVDLTREPSWLTPEERKRCLVTADLNAVVALPELQVVLNITADPEIQRQLQENPNKGIEVVQIPPDGFVMSLLHLKGQLFESRVLKGELWAVLNSVQDAIEVVDARGTIKYVNPAFTRVTGIPERKRINLNIFEISPYGALAQSLIRQKPITGYRTFVGGSNVEVVSNASPIIVDGEVQGAVVVFQPVNDILKLMDELKHSNTVIENLYAEIVQLAGSSVVFDDLVGSSKIFHATVEMARRAARHDNTVLVTGESGTGKSLFVHAIHNSSARRKRPLIQVDCTAVPESLQEVELFGCEKGALPGMVCTKLGKVELARGGTLYLKEVGVLSKFVQEKLLRLLQERQFARIGSDSLQKADFRLIVSSTSNLQAAVLNGSFLEELYSQLVQFRLHLPPLRDRLDDLPLLVDLFVQQFNRKLGKQVNKVTSRALQGLAEYDWPGNISELKFIVERAMVLAEGTVLDYTHFSTSIGKVGESFAPPPDEIMPLEKMEQVLLKQALTRYGETLEGKKKAARALNISLATLYNKLKKYRANF